MSNADVADRLSPTQQYAILALVVLSSTGSVATILVATALLPQMQGALSATQGEIVAMPLTG